MPTTIEVVQGDITEQDVDAIVNAANNHLWMGSGVAGAIARRGGRGIEDEAIRQGPIHVGEAVLTSGGALLARYVIHAAAMGQDLQTDGEKIRAATAAALDLARARGCKSLAVPALGTGVGGFPARECARIMLDAVRSASAAAEAVPLVRFVLFDAETAQVFREAAGL